MTALRVILSIIFAIICIVFTVTVLAQEGKSAGLGAIGGMAETYYGKNKGRTMEGRLEKITVVMGVLFVVISIILNLNF